MDWNIKIDNNLLGPYSTDQLLSMYQNNKIGINTTVSPVGEDKWVSLVTAFPFIASANNTSAHSGSEVSSINNTLKRAEIYMRNNAFDEAQKLLDFVLKREPNNAFAMFLMGVYYLNVAQLSVRYPLADDEADNARYSLVDLVPRYEKLLSLL
jgi:hypothetical protein